MVSGPLALALPQSAALRRLRGIGALTWLGHPSAYAVGVCVVSLMSMATTLVAPRLLDPAAFGAFALLGTVLQYAAKADLGLSQLADREIAASRGGSGRLGEDILRASWVLGILGLAILVPVAVAGAMISQRFSPLDAALAVTGGVLGMVAHAPTSIFRAASQHWEFTTLALLQQSGLTAPRLAGLAVAGVTGCFAVLAVWSGVLAAVFARPRLGGSWRPECWGPLVRSALPLFVFNGLWLVYMTANRWVSAALSTPEELGHFAFGANLAMVGLALVGAISQVRYPKLLTRMAHASPSDASMLFERETLLVSAVLAPVALAATFVAAPIVHGLFPGYEPAAAATVGLAASCVPLGLVAWIIPMAMVLTPNPLADAVRVMVPALVVLVAAVAAGNAVAGISGQGWACAPASVFMIASVAAMLRRRGVISAARAFRITAVQLAIVAALSAVAAVWSAPIPAPLAGGEAGQTSFPRHLFRSVSP